MNAAAASSRRWILGAVGGEAVVAAGVEIADAASAHAHSRNLEIGKVVHLVVLLEQRRSQR